MHILLIIVTFMDFIILTLLPFLYAMRTPRNRHAKKGDYVLGVVIFLATLAVTLYVRNDLFTIPLFILVYVCLCQWLFNRGKIALFYQVIYMILLFLVQYIMVGATSFLYRSVDIDPVALNCITLILKFIMETVYTLILIQVVNYKNITEISRRQLAGLFIIPIFSLINIFSLFVVGDIYYALYGYTLYIVNVVFLLLINFYCLYLYYDFSKHQEMKRQLELNRQQNEIAFKYYETMDARIEQTRKVIHDVRNHINAIEQLYDSGNVKAGDSYVKDIHSLLDSLGIRQFTGNRMLNMILNDKLSAAERLGIHTETHLEQLDLDFIRDMDMTTIFSNLLDNAIEAASDVKQGFIEIKSVYFNDMLTIHIKNPVREDSRLNGADLKPNYFHPVTTKAGHLGVGLDNVSQTVKKYHGHLSLSCENHLFCASLLFNLKGSGEGGK